MSRHIIDCFDSSLTVLIGWDRPLRNYFAQVVDAEQNVVHWVMGEPTPELVAEYISEYAAVSPELIETLKQEERDGLDHPMSLSVDHRTSTA